MAELPASRWNPSKVLKIVTADNNIPCVGITLKGLSCGYDLGGDPKAQARHLLNSMSQRSPRNTLNSLPELARLCLCQKNHQKQTARVVDTWTSVIESYASSLERREYLPRTHVISSSSPVHTPSQPPSQRELTVGEITAELDALSFRQAELRSMLQKISASDAGSEWTSLSQTTSDSSNQTPPTDSGSSKSGLGQTRDSPSARDGLKSFFGRGKLSK